VSAPIRRRREGRYALNLDPSVRAVLASMAEQVPALLEEHDPMTKRLFPPAYPALGFEDAERDYRALVDHALVEHHREAFAVLAETSDADSLTEPELQAWMSAIGSIRLVLGTRLDVSEDMHAPDPEDPSAGEYALYELLGQLQYLMVEVLAAELPEEGRPDEVL
jgi:Domain of unknown function (DUF2017)